LTADSDYHMPADAFCAVMEAKGVRADAVLFDQLWFSAEFIAWCLFRL
jgi:hypothetical protein